METGDCHDPNGSENRCVAGAIKNFTSQLLHYQEGTSDRKCQSKPENCKSWIGSSEFGSRENSMVLRFPQQKEILKRNFLHPKNVNERKQAVFWFVLYEKSYLFLSLPWQIIWLKPCCSCHTSWVTSIRWSDLTIMQEIPPYFLKTFEPINSPVW